MKHATTLKTKDKYIIHSNSDTTTGLEVATAPYLHFPLDEACVDICNGLLQALNASKTIVPHPADFAMFTKIYVSECGFKTWSELHKKSLMCHVSLDEDQIIFSPNKREKRGGGYSGLGKDMDEMVSLSAGFQEVIYAMNRAFDKCD